jgi:hypothetical protein
MFVHVPNQLFRLELWRLFLRTMNNSDLNFINDFKIGVQLGVNYNISPFFYDPYSS